MSSAQGQRIEANCMIIWGNDCEYDLDIETDDYVNYMCYVKKDFGDSFGPPLMISSLCRSSEAAWAELDRMLELWAKQVKRGTPKVGGRSCVESCGIFCVTGPAGVSSFRVT